MAVRFLWLAQRTKSGQCNFTNHRGAKVFEAPSSSSVRLTVCSVPLVPRPSKYHFSALRAGGLHTIHVPTPDSPSPEAGAVNSFRMPQWAASRASLHLSRKLLSCRPALEAR